MRAPLTAMMFGLELTHDINALLPLLHRLRGRACDHRVAAEALDPYRKIARRGHHIVREYSVDPFEAVRIADVMARPAETVSADASVGEIVDFFTASNAPRRHKSYPVTDQLGRLVGIVSRADALQWMMSDGLRGNLVVEQLSGQELIVGYEDELVGQLADRMAESGRGRVPILRRSDGVLVGLAARRDLLRVRATVVQHEREREVLIRFGDSRATSVQEQHRL